MKRTRGVEPRLGSAPARADGGDVSERASERASEHRLVRPGRSRAEIWL